MSEQTILVCDECGRPAAKTATIRIDNRNMVKDLCVQHVREITAHTRVPRRGRKAATVLTVPARRSGRPKGSTTKSTKARSRKVTNKRRKNAKRRSAA
jgi:hypothetical protein